MSHRSVLRIYRAVLQVSFTKVLYRWQISPMLDPKGRPPLRRDSVGSPMNGEEVCECMREDMRVCMRVCVCISVCV